MTTRKPRIKFIKWCEKHRFTPTNLAKALEVATPSTIWEWKYNGRNPHPSTLERFDALIAKVEKDPFPAKELFDEF